MILLLQKPKSGQGGYLLDTSMSEWFKGGFPMGGSYITACPLERVQGVPTVNPPQPWYLCGTFGAVDTLPVEWTTSSPICCSVSSCHGACLVNVVNFNMPQMLLHHAANARNCQGYFAFLFSWQESKYSIVLPCRPLSTCHPGV